MTDLFVDGGVICKNPSPYGGTWAWCLVEKDKIIKQDSGIIQPTEMKLKAIANNFMEMWAAYQGLSAMEEEWNGDVHTDSQVTKWRLTSSNSFSGIPNFLKDHILHLRSQGLWNVVLMAGHPTKTELSKGFRNKNRLPASKWNVWCDEECTRLSREFLQRKG